MTKGEPPSIDDPLIFVKKEEGVQDSCTQCKKEEECDKPIPNQQMLCLKEEETEHVSQCGKITSIGGLANDQTSMDKLPVIPTPSDSDRFTDFPLTPESYKSGGKLSPPASSSGSPPSSSGIHNTPFSARWGSAAASPTSSTGHEFPQTSEGSAAAESMIHNSKAAQRGMELMKSLLPDAPGPVNDMLTSYIMKMSLIALRAMIAFCKELPIFSDLSWESQAALIKGMFNMLKENLLFTPFCTHALPEVFKTYPK